MATDPEKSPVTNAEASTAWPALTADHPLQKLIDVIPKTLQDAGYDEVYGIQLSSSSPFHRNLILQKFLRANANDVDKALEQLSATLKWRKSFQPLKAREETFSKIRFGGLGYVTEATGVPGSTSPRAKDTITFNIYGAVKDNAVTFGDLDGFMRWRVGLMELSLKQLHLEDAKEPIPDYGSGNDPYQAIQVHDYLNISFLRQHPDQKAAASKAIETFKNYYPETLSRKFFVNVPVVMGWLFSAMKMVLSRETVRKFTVLSYGKDLAAELGTDIPEVYGGRGKPLEKASLTLKEE